MLVERHNARPGQRTLLMCPTSCCAWHVMSVLPVQSLLTCKNVGAGAPPSWPAAHARRRCWLALRRCRSIARAPPRLPPAPGMRWRPACHRRRARLMNCYLRQMAAAHALYNIGLAHHMTVLLAILNVAYVDALSRLSTFRKLQRLLNRLLNQAACRADGLDGLQALALAQQSQARPPATPAAEPAGVSAAASEPAPLQASRLKRACSPDEGHMPSIEPADCWL